MATAYSLASSALPDDVRAILFHGMEQIGRPYELEVYFETDKPEELDLEDAVGGKASFSVEPEDGEPFTWHGMLRSVEHLHEMQGTAVCRAVLVPHLWQLTQTRHSNIFTKKSIPEIIEAVLLDGGLSTDDFEFKLDHSYEKEEHVCQYHESHLDFIHRWMEMVGIYYYFKHEDGQEKVFFTDHMSFHDAGPPEPIRYYPRIDDDKQSVGEVFTQLICRRSALPASVSLRDYDYGNPSLAMAGQADVSKTGVGEINVYGGRFFTEAEGKWLARVRSEELLVGEQTFHGEGTGLFIRSGYLFEVEQHPRDYFNKKFLAIRVQHRGVILGHKTVPMLLKRIPGHQEPPESIYENSVEAMAKAISDSKDAQYRQARTTAWPRIDGYENGIVDGEASSQYAQIDDHGRYNVKFNFDESDLKDGKASTWVRMAQPHGGTTEGFHFPLRKGTEIICAFLGGDPDRPVIVGVVPNAHTPSPITSGNHTKNMIRTGAGNHITIDDNEGKEFIHLFTPKLTELWLGGPTNGEDQETQTHSFMDSSAAKSDTCADTDVATSYYMYTDGNSGVLVDGQLWETIGGDIRRYGGGQVLEQYFGPHVLNISENANHYYHSALNVEVLANRDQKITGTDTTFVEGGLTHQTYKTGHQLDVESGQTINVQGGQTIDVQGNQTITVADTKTETVTGAYTLTVEGGTVVELKGPKQENVDGPWGQWYKSDNISVTWGLTSSTHLGLKNTNTLASSISVNVAVNLTGNCSASFNFTTGVKATFDSTIDLRATPFQIETSAAGWMWQSTGCFMVQTPTLVFTGAAFMSRAAIQMIN